VIGTSRFTEIAALSFAVATALVMSSATADAHKAITSRFTYNADVFPVFAARCGHCHVSEGVAPMSLVSYEDAFPWAESLRAELLDAGAGAGSGGDSFIKEAHRGLTARELDIVLDWAVGGTPEGDAPKPSPPALRKNEWAGGTRPDLVLEPASSYEIAADSMESTKEFVLPVNVDRKRTIRAIDVLPGTPSVVREVQLHARLTDGQSVPLGTWTPRQTPAALIVHSDVALGPGSSIVAEIHYKKTWKFEGQLLSDRSQVGIYFSAD